MTRAPIISLFPTAGGVLQANGVLARADWGGGTDRAVGFFAPWPSLLGSADFRVYAPGSKIKGALQHLLVPDEVAILALPNHKPNPNLGVVTFTSEPAISSPKLAIDRGLDNRKLEDILNGEYGSWIDIFAKIQPEIFKRLKNLTRTTRISEQPNAPILAPQINNTEARMINTAAAVPNSLICRIILRAD